MVSLTIFLYRTSSKSSETLELIQKYCYFEQDNPLPLIGFELAECGRLSRTEHR